VGDIPDPVWHAFGSCWVFAGSCCGRIFHVALRSLLLSHNVTSYKFTRYVPGIPLFVGEEFQFVFTFSAKMWG
jgi:hypothetical protein